MRLELTRVGLLVELVNHYTTRGALGASGVRESGKSMLAAWLDDDDDDDE